MSRRIATSAVKGLGSGGGGKPLQLLRPGVPASGPRRPRGGPSPIIKPGHLGVRVVDPPRPGSCITMDVSSQACITSMGSWVVLPAGPAGGWACTTSLAPRI